MGITSIARDWGISPAIVRITTTDNLAAITTAGYLLAQEDNIAAVNSGPFDWAESDYVLCYYNNGTLWGFFTYIPATGSLAAAATSPGFLSSTLTSANIFVGNGANLATGVAMSGDATMANTGAITIANNAVTFAKLAETVAKSVTVALTDTQIKGMYAAPVQLVAAPGAGKLILVDRVVLSVTFVAAQYAAGGVITAQYDSTINGAGSAASGTIAAATLNGIAASTQLSVNGASVIAANTACINKGIYLSNQTAAFTTGDSTVSATVYYKIITPA